MKKIMNDPMQYVDETLEGIVLAHPGKLKFAGEEKRGIMRADLPAKGKVAIATGGGSGHLPLFLGYVGKGLADGASVGNVFTSPSADAMVNVAKAIHSGSGVLFLYGHYFGDKMNFDLAAEILEDEENIRVESVRASDDAASAPRERWRERRGIAGIFFAYKIAGACAEEMASLDEVKKAAEKAVSQTATMGVALTSCTIPASGQPTFEIAGDEMELGMGIHGEPGIKRTKIVTAKEIADQILMRLIEDLELNRGDEVSVLVNGSGATPPEELYILYREVYRILAEKKISIGKAYVGEFATSLEMTGCSVSLLKLDGELKRYLNAPASSPLFQAWSGGEEE